MTNPIRILVADDHPIVREGLAAILSTQSDFTVVGEAANGEEAIAGVADLAPDLLLIDLEMPGIDGVEAIRRIRNTHPNLRAIVFTVFDTDERIMSALEAGAQGYLLKGTPREEIFNAVRVVHAGGSLLQPVVASTLLRHIDKRNNPSPTELDPLTDRELEVLHHLARGRTNREIAEELTITERTAKFHVSSILSKLNARNRTEAVAIARKHSLLDL